MMEKHLKRFGILYVILTYLLFCTINLVWIGVGGPEIYWLFMAISGGLWIGVIEILEYING